MSKIFNRQMSKVVKKWAFLSLPQRRLEFAFKSISKHSETYNADFAAKAGAIDHLVHMTNEVKYHNKAYAFKALSDCMYSKRYSEVETRYF